jgi:hypothetical protein
VRRRDALRLADAMLTSAASDGSTRWRQQRRIRLSNKPYYIVVIDHATETDDIVYAGTAPCCVR